MSYTNNFDSKTSNLLQLTEIVTPKKLSKLDILDTNGTTKANQLYRLLTEGKITTEEGLMDALFDKSPHQRGNFNRVKRQLEEKLVNTLFLVDGNQNLPQDIQRAYYFLCKQATAVKILIGKGARRTAFIIAKKAFMLAEHYEFTDLLLSLSQDLRSHYGVIARDEKLFIHYNEKVKYYANVLSAELKAEEYYSELMLLISQSRSSRIDHREIVELYASESEKLINSYHSYKLNLYAFTIIAMQYEMIYDYENTIITCDRALLFFSNKKHLASNTAIFTFYFRKVSSLILLGKLTLAEETIKKCLDLETPGTPNWYKLQEYGIITNFHLHQYQESYKVYISVIENQSFNSQYPDIKEAWYIYEAFTYYFYIQNVFKGIVNDRLKKFRISRFLNEVPTYSKDKRGMNTTILILQVLFLLHQKQYGKIIDRTEALRTYTHRYLRRDETFRSNCFIKMLMQLPKANFHRVAVERKTKELREKLSSVGIIQNQSAEVEIVPYEVLWEFVLESLDNKIH